MPSGDAGRTWFPEMIDELKKKWKPSTSWEEYSRLCDEMTKVRKKIRKEKEIKPVNKKQRGQTSSQPIKYLT